MIKLKNGWCIDSDGRCYILQQEVTVLKGEHKGEKYIANQTYHSTLTAALEKLMHRGQMDIISNNDLTLKEAVKEFEKLNDEFKWLLIDVHEKECL